VPPNSATAIEYGTASPIARIRVGKISAYTAGPMDEKAPRKTSAIDIATNSDHGDGPRIAFSG